MSDKYRTTIIASIIAVVVVTSIAVVVLSVYGAEARATPALATISGLALLVVTNLLTLLKAERIEHELNGKLSELKDSMQATHDAMDAGNA